MYTANHLFSVPNNVKIIVISRLNRDTIISGESCFSVMHDGPVVVCESTRIDLTAAVFVEVVKHRRVNVLLVDCHVLVSIGPTLLMM